MTETIHEYAFEVWPDPLPQASYPMLIPGRVTARAADLDTGRQLAGQSITAGQALGAVSHWRTRCQPPHPGR
jgi:hypothetical protein